MAIKRPGTPLPDRIWWRWSNNPNSNLPYVVERATNRRATATGESFTPHMVGRFATAAGARDTMARVASRLGITVYPPELPPQEATP